MKHISPRSLPSRSRRTRAVYDENKRDEGTGGPSGVVLPLNMVGAGMYEAVYTVAVQVGSNNQNFSLQVDTGSSDLWIASTSCSSSACSSSKGRQYDPSASGNATGSNFQIQYLAGKASGPIYWDKVQIGAYTVNNQALAATTSVDSEPLEHEFNGILGLALPLNSIIAQQITPVTGNGRDGAPFVSNLFGTPASSAPSSRFLSLSLARPGSSAIPSLLGIGRHPSELVHDPSKIKYSTVVQESQGSLFWQVQVRAITVYVNGSSFSVKLDNPRSGNVLPVAVLDSGVPYILAESSIANGIYGALGIGPASDGQYYVPCTTPINMTILIDGQAEIPIHPLDLSTQSVSDPSSSTCVGLIQTGGGALDTTPSVSDMILGAAFLRNVYTVMAYDAPDARGTFPNDSASTAIHPHVGFLSLTSAAQAMEEFHNVRVLNQPLSSSDNPSPPTSGTGAPSNSGKLSVGIVVLCVLVGIIGACIMLFGLRWILVRRRLRRSPHLDANAAEPKFGGALTTYSLARQTSRSPAHMSSAVSIAGNSARTVVGQDETLVGEFGIRDKDGADRVVSYLNLDPGDPAGWRDTLVETSIDFPKLPDPASALEAAMLGSDEPISSTRDAALSATVAAGLPLHRHSASDIGAGPDKASAAEPLLAHNPRPSNDSSASLGAISERGVPGKENGNYTDDEVAEFGAGSESMAGIGTAARSSRIRARHGSGAESFASLASFSSPSVSLGNPGSAPRSSLNTHFLNLAPGERLSAYSLTEVIIPPKPPPPP